MMLEFIRSYPVSVIIAEKRGKGVLWSFDSARRIKRDDGTQAYRLKKNKTNFPPPDYSYLHLGKKGKPVLPLFSPQEGQFIPMDLKNPMPILTVEDKEITFWSVLETDRTHSIYPKKMGFLEKYGTFVSIGIVLATLLFMVIFLGDKLSAMAGNINNAAIAFREAAQLIANSRPLAPLGG